MFHYYTQNGSKFDSKVEALEYSKKTNTPVYFYYYDHVYDKVNWTLEPTQSLQALYKDQCQRLRDKYDYLILCYSGGYDSTNILETFHYNNIKLDKLVTIGAFDQDKYSVSDENHNGEIYHNVLPYVEELGLSNILQVLDYSKLFNSSSNFSILNQKDSWIDLCGAWFSPHHWFWYDIEKYIVPQELKHKKVAIIFGKDKPALHSTLDKPLSCFQFSDTPITSYGSTVTKRQKNNNVDIIDFYWDPEAPQILVKQLHVLRRYFNLHGNAGYDTKQSIGTIGNKSINSLIYDLKKPILFKSPKSKTFYLSLRDEFLRTKRNNDISEIHAKGIKELFARVGTQEPKPIGSKYYSIL